MVVPAMSNPSSVALDMPYALWLELLELLELLLDAELEDSELSDDSEDDDEERLDELDCSSSLTSSQPRGPITYKRRLVVL